MRFFSPFLLGITGLVNACGGSGSYELSWTLGCDKRPNACQAESTASCSVVGIDSIEVLARPANAPGDTQLRSLFACFSADVGAIGRGPGLSAASWALEIYTLTPAGQRLTGPVNVQVQIPQSGYSKAQVDLPLAPRCSDGVDNDRDGFVDRFDPDCSDAQDDDESR